MTKTATITTQKVSSSLTKKKTKTTKMTALKIETMILSTSLRTSSGRKKKESSKKLSLLSHRRKKSPSKNRQKSKKKKTVLTIRCSSIDTLVKNLCAKTCRESFSFTSGKKANSLRR